MISRPAIKDKEGTFLRQVVEDDMLKKVEAEFLKLQELGFAPESFSVTLDENGHKRVVMIAVEDTP